MKFSSLVMLILILTFGLNAQNNQYDSLDFKNDFNYKGLIVPVVLIGYGWLGFENDGIKALNYRIRHELLEQKMKKVSIDDYLQYSPLLAVYGLNGFGIKGQHNFLDRTLLLVTSYGIMNTTVMKLKSLTKVKRPSADSNNSFPSMHTATAFMGAEFLWQEYKDVSIWFGIAGYSAAIVVAAYRIFNEAHWLSDVAAGAGIGMLSVKIVYWIFPYVKKALFKKKISNKMTASIMPLYNGKQIGFGLTVSF